MCYRVVMFILFKQFFNKSSQTLHYLTYIIVYRFKLIRSNIAWAVKRSGRNLLVAETRPLSQYIVSCINDAISLASNVLYCIHTYVDLGSENEAARLMLVDKRSSFVRELM